MAKWRLEGSDEDRKPRFGRMYCWSEYFEEGVRKEQKSTHARAQTSLVKSEKDWPTFIQWRMALVNDLDMYIHMNHPREKGWNYYYESKEEPPREVLDGLLGVAEALHDGRDEGAEVELKVLGGEHGCGGQGLERAPGDPEVGVSKEVQAAVDERRRLGGGEAPSRGLRELEEALPPSHPVVGTL
ncbi:hypothetical protein CRG98_014537 [Punica granatum]|uniref:Uncharacterized protein n=1 Tax=Punica granatum TaxID=22663 RepID=A0A2I0K938_PUNGR|nr:hypothetical protein CRG98_014537 [Punica granatum]